MNVLLLTQAFPPAPVVGAFRPQLLAKALAERGHRVLVLSAENGAGATAAELEPGVRIVEVRPYRGLGALYGAVRRRVRSAPEETHASGEGERLEAKRSPLRRIAVGLLSTPDDLQGYVPGAIAAAIRNRSFHPDLIYSTAPAFSIHLAGLVLERVFRVPWIAEFRDPWVENASPRPASDSGVSARLDRWLEARVVSRASGIVSVTAAASNRLKQRYPAKAAQAFITALNGIDRIRTERARRAGDAPLRVVYAGSVYPPRDPAPMLRSLGEVLPKGRVLDATFVGDIDDSTRARLEGCVLGSDVRLRFVEWLPRAEAQELIRDADLLLLPAQAWSLQVPGKLYDYLGSRVPIFALVEPGSETESMLGAAGGHVTAAVGDAAALAPATREALRIAAEPRRLVGSASVLHEWSTERQFDQLVDWIVNLAPE